MFLGHDSNLTVQVEKFFAFAIAIVAMATSMVSCNNDNADFIEQKAPVAPASATVQDTKEMHDISLLVAVTPEQKNYFDETYTIQTPGQTQTIMVSEMTPATQEQIAAFQKVRDLNDAFSELDDKVEIEFYSIKLGRGNNFSSTKILTHRIEMKANHPTDEFNYLNAAGIYFNGQIVSSKLDIRLFKGIQGDDDEVKGFAEVRNQYQ